jgi:hypothetical protein
MGNFADHKTIRPRTSNLGENRRRIEKIGNSVPRPPNSSPNNAPRHGRLSGSPKPPAPPSCPGSFPEAPVPSLPGRTSPAPACPAPLPQRQRKVEGMPAKVGQAWRELFCPPGEQRAAAPQASRRPQTVLSVPGAPGAPMQTAFIGAAGRKGRRHQTVFIGAREGRGTVGRGPGRQGSADGKRCLSARRPPRGMGTAGPSANGGKRRSSRRGHRVQPHRAGRPPEGPAPAGGTTGRTAGIMKA